MGITNLGGLVTLHQDNPQNLAWLQIAQCIRTFPKLWIDLLTNRNDWQLNSYTKESINIGDSIWIKGQYASTKQIRSFLAKQYITPIDKVDIIQRHSLDLNSNSLDSTPDNPFKLRIVSSPYLQSLHYRILHKAVTTRAKLFQYGKLDTPECPFCDEQNDVLEHALYKCDLAKHTWQNFQRWLDKYNIPLTIQVVNVIMGIKENVPFGSLLNTIILLIKRIFISPMESRRALSLQEIENIVKVQLQVERAQVNIIVKKQKNARILKFNKRWSYLLHMIE